MLLLSLLKLPVAQGCVNRLDKIVEQLIVTFISEQIHQNILKRTLNKKLIPNKDDADNKINLDLGKIHKEVAPLNDSTFEVFVLYGIPAIGLYTAAMFMDGIPNCMCKLEYGFYMTITVSFDDFQGINDYHSVHYALCHFHLL